MPLGIEIFARAVPKRSLRGLFAGKGIKFGNKVSEDGKNKTRRNWKPNVQRKRLYSEVLEKQVAMNVTTHALRVIDRHGGLDNYLCRTPDSKIASVTGVKLKNQIRNARKALLAAKKLQGSCPDSEAAEKLPPKQEETVGLVTREQKREVDIDKSGKWTMDKVVKLARGKKKGTMMHPFVLEKKLEKV